MSRFRFVSPSRWLVAIVSMLAVIVVTTDVRSAHGQDVHLRVFYLQNAYAMDAVGNALAQRNQDLRTQIGVPTAVVDRYPSHPSVRADLLFIIDGPWRGGLSGGYGSTGGRIAYTDDTGAFRLDEVVKRWYLGGFVGRHVVSPTPWLGVVAATHLRLMTSTREETRTLSVTEGELPNDQNGETRVTSAPGLGVVPEVAVEANWGRFAVRTHVGYEWTVQARTIDYNLVSLQTPNGPKVEWDGIRFGVAVGARLF